MEEISEKVETYVLIRRKRTYEGERQQRGVKKSASCSAAVNRCGELWIVMRKKCEQSFFSVAWQRHSFAALPPRRGCSAATLSVQEKILQNR